MPAELERHQPETKTWRWFSTPVTKQTKMYQVCYKVQIHFVGLLEISLLPGFPFLSTSHHTWQWFSYRLSGHNLTQHKFSGVKMQISLNLSRFLTNREIYPNPVLDTSFDRRLTKTNKTKCITSLIYLHSFLNTFCKLRRNILWCKNCKEMTEFFQKQRKFPFCSSPVSQENPVSQGDGKNVCCQKDQLSESPPTKSGLTGRLQTFFSALKKWWTNKRPVVIFWFVHNELTAVPAPFPQYFVPW